MTDKIDNRCEGFNDGGTRQSASPCLEPAKYHEDDKWWCGRHAPSKVKARSKKRVEKEDAETKVWREKYKSWHPKVRQLNLHDHTKDELTALYAEVERLKGEIKKLDDTDFTIDRHAAHLKREADLESHAASLAGALDIMLDHVGHNNDADKERRRDARAALAAWREAMGTGVK